MFKLATLSAVAVAATSVEEFQDTIETFKVKIEGSEVQEVERAQNKLMVSKGKYEKGLAEGPHGAQFKKEIEAIAATDEFRAIGEQMELLKEKAHQQGTPLNTFIPKYKAQVQKVMIAEKKLKQTTKVDSVEDRAEFDVDNDQWFEFNKEYYKLREMEYYALYKIPGIVVLRKKLTRVRNTEEFEDFSEHWHDVTQTDIHQKLVKRQAQVIMAAAKLLHMSKQDKKWISPKYSPVMHDAWYGVYLWYVAIGKGNLEPLLDFAIDGEYADEYEKAVKPKFGRPEENLYLY